MWRAFSVCLLLFQSKAESLLQKEASIEPASRLQSLRDRDALTRFDREVSDPLTPTDTTTRCSRTRISVFWRADHSSVFQADPDRTGREDSSSPLHTRVKFWEAARRVRLETRVSGRPTEITSSCGSLNDLIWGFMYFL